MITYHEIMTALCQPGGRDGVERLAASLGLNVTGMSREAAAKAVARAAIRDSLDGRGVAA